MTTRLTDEQLSALIQDVSSWAPDADPVLVEESVRRACAIMESDPYGIAPIAFVGAMLRIGFMVDGLDAVLRITEHLVESMKEWTPIDDPGDKYHA